MAPIVGPRASGGRYGGGTDGAKRGGMGPRRARRPLGEVAATALPDTILAWYRRLIARKFDGSQARRAPGRPRIDREVEQLIVRMAEEPVQIGCGDGCLLQRSRLKR